MTKFKFSDLKFKERTWGMDDLACALAGMNPGTTQAYYEFDNGYMLSVLTDTYLCTKNTYEIGILYDKLLCTVEKEKALHNRLVGLGLQHDKSLCLVYGKVTKTKLEKVAQILEMYKGGKHENIKRTDELQTK